MAGKCGAPPGSAAATGKELTPDQQLDNIIAQLDSLPRELRHANPSTYPNYEQRLRQEIGQVSTVSTAPSSGAEAQASGWRCTLEVGAVIAGYGIPASKVVKWLKEAKAIWGGFKGILAAVRSGAASREIGGEAAELLGVILGSGGVKKHCFG